MIRITWIIIWLIVVACLVELVSPRVSADLLLRTLARRLTVRLLDLYSGRGSCADCGRVRQGSPPKCAEDARQSNDQARGSGDGAGANDEFIIDGKRVDANPNDSLNHGSLFVFDLDRSSLSHVSLLVHSIAFRYSSALDFSIHDNCILRACPSLRINDPQRQYDTRLENADGRGSASEQFLLCSCGKARLRIQD